MLISRVGSIINLILVVKSRFPVSKKYFTLAKKFFAYKMALCRYMHLLGGKFIQFFFFLLEIIKC